jgi:hypothetical protein
MCVYEYETKISFSDEKNVIFEEAKRYNKKD